MLEKLPQGFSLSAGLKMVQNCEKLKRPNIPRKYLASLVLKYSHMTSITRLVFAHFNWFDVPLLHWMFLDALASLQSILFTEWVSHSFFHITNVFQMFIFQILFKSFTNIFQNQVPWVSQLCQMSNVKCQVSNLKWQQSNDKSQMSNAKCNIKRQCQGQVKSRYLVRSR